MKTSMAFALALALIGAAHATTQHAAAAPAKAHVIATPAAQPAATPVQNGAASTAGSNNNLVCPPGINPQQPGAASKCFPRPTRSVQR